MLLMEVSSSTSYPCNLHALTRTIYSQTQLGALMLDVERRWMRSKLSFGHVGCGDRSTETSLLSDFSASVFLQNVSKGFWRGRLLQTHTSWC